MLFLLAVLPAILIGSLLLGAFDRDEDDDDTGEPPRPRAGDDLILGNDLSNFIDAGTGDDTVRGNGGDDWLDGSAGDDILSGGDGNDQIRGESGNDTLLGGDGNDEIRDRYGEDTLFGGAGDDRLDAVDTFNAPDTLEGGAGNDRIVGGQSDILTGGSGDDLFLAAVQSGGIGDPLQVTDFDPEEDVLDIRLGHDNPTPLEISVRAGGDGLLVSDAFGQYAILQGLTAEQIPSVMAAIRLDGAEPVFLQRGTEGDDSLTTSPQATLSLEGGGGDDDIFLLHRHGGVDAGAGNDRVFGDEFGDGRDATGAGIDLGDGDDRAALRGEVGSTVWGGAGDDTIRTTLADWSVHGGEGDDTLVNFPTGEAEYLASGRTILDGGAGDDSISAGFGDTLTGGEGTDSFRVFTTDFDDEIVVITDFDTTAETLFISSNQLDPAAADALVITRGAAPGDAVVSINGQAVVRLADIIDLAALRAAITVDGLPAT